MTTDSAAASLRHMPDDARLWVFAADRTLDDAQAERLLGRVDRFLEEWHAHGHPVTGARELRDRRFLLVAADERATGVSGCSTDSLFRQLKHAEQDEEVSMLDRSLVFWREAQGEVRSDSRAGFRERLSAGELDDRTPVFDPTIATVGALRAGRWELPLGESWHARLRE